MATTDDAGLMLSFVLSCFIDTVRYVLIVCGGACLALCCLRVKEQNPDLFRVSGVGGRACLTFGEPKKVFSRVSERAPGALLRLHNDSLGRPLVYVLGDDVLGVVQSLARRVFPSEQAIIG